eukprot:TRINITY_DN16027_c0_g1_i1.p1 TRINITY_DN16027_c0_g1~~TRINITY_DN16027_c0_g1_i1.p1  ORF type:complete len:179 (+),score=31.92 TRINITY_DN16027_c0_g1_i1:50-538(+)
MLSDNVWLAVLSLVALLLQVGCVHIESPYSIMGKVDYSMAQFGLPYLTVEYDVGEVVTAVPYRACRPLWNKPEMKGKICLVERGDCTFTTMTEMCEEAGAMGVLVANNETDTMTSMMSGTSHVKLRAAMIPKHTGDAILSELQSGETVVVKLGHSIAFPPYL